ncbi:MAG: helix-turn-helix domain-containing protein [Verrucomicrobiota bacterium]|jgi:excisionase family DNA binding protein
MKTTEIKTPRRELPETLTARQTAETLGVSYPTVLRLIKRNKLKCLPLRRKLIPRSELERFLAEELR